MAIAALKQGWKNYRVSDPLILLSSNSIYHFYEFDRSYSNRFISSENVVQHHELSDKVRPEEC